MGIEQRVYFFEKLLPCNHRILDVLGRDLSSCSEIRIPRIHVQEAGQIVILEPGEVLLLLQLGDAFE